MITENDLIKLGYRIKGDSGGNRGVDYRFGNIGDRDYLINLSNDGLVTVINSHRRKAKAPNNISDIEKFMEWHDSYEV